MRRRAQVLGVLIALVLAAGCAGPRYGGEVPAPSAAAPDIDYLIGPGDTIQIFVWRNPEVSTSVPVRPDGKISVPLVEDLPVAGKTPTQVAREIEQVLSRYIRNPVVTVIVSGFSGVFSQQVRVVGQAAQPQAIPYRKGMTLLDVMIAVGGLTDFAAGDKASIVRVVDGKQTQLRVHLDRLLRDGDVSANVPVLPGDILIIPEAWF
ncbi:XrtA/PEP-CTERM system exopolysaccharide export protein [Inmirania thermothiophila]|uniref:XrtA/PEP-CTERM system exopolysaccharide export protein n=1 Tax=Inmirania thermothiophila TaxID=1750597 RepID=UPI000F48633B|nr:XrtA/PEP-CTERM system exopolysaccharide export protein [Inmirania thermothiophila]